MKYIFSFKQDCESVRNTDKSAAFFFSVYLYLPKKMESAPALDSGLQDQIAKGIALKPSGRILENQPKVEADLKDQIAKG